MKHKHVVLTVAVCMLAAFLFFSLAWTRIAVKQVNENLRASGVQVRVNGIRGAFPLDFTVESANVYEFATVYGLHVVYHGTYNPFKVLSQHGKLATVNGRATVSLLGHESDVLIRDVVVSRGVQTPNDWQIEGTVDVNNFAVNVWLFFGENGDDNLVVDVPSLDIKVKMSRRHVHLQYAKHDVLSFVRNPQRVKEPTVDDIFLLLGSIMHAHATIKQHDGGGIDVSNVTWSLYDHPMHSMVGSANIYLEEGAVWNSGKGGHVVAVHKTPNRRRRLAPRRLFDVDFDGQRVVLQPPVSTPLGDLRAVFVDYDLREMHIDVGTMPLLLHARGSLAGHPKLSAEYGPITASVHQNGIVVDINGGFFSHVKCVRAEARLQFAEPHVVHLKMLNGKLTNGEHLYVHGKYDLKEEKLTVGVELEG